MRVPDSKIPEHLLGLEDEKGKVPTEIFFNQKSINPIPHLTTFTFGFCPQFPGKSYEILCRYIMK